MEVIVQYCSSWDGGQQELSAASAFIQEVFEDAVITPKCVETSPNQVIIFTVQNGEQREVTRCMQRDLYRKYKWPAKAGILKALKEIDS